MPRVLNRKKKKSLIKKKKIKIPYKKKCTRAVDNKKERLTQLFIHRSDQLIFPSSDPVDYIYSLKYNPDYLLKSLKWLEKLHRLDRMTPHEQRLYLFYKSIYLYKVRVFLKKKKTLKLKFRNNKIAKKKTLILLKWYRQRYDLPFPSITVFAEVFLPKYRSIYFEMFWIYIYDFRDNIANMEKSQKVQQELRAEELKLGPIPLHKLQMDELYKQHIRTSRDVFDHTLSRLIEEEALYENECDRNYIFVTGGKFLFILSHLHRISWFKRICRIIYFPLLSYFLAHYTSVYFFLFVMIFSFFHSVCFEDTGFEPGIWAAVGIWREKKEFELKQNMYIYFFIFCFLSHDFIEFFCAFILFIYLFCLTWLFVLLVLFYILWITIITNDITVIYVLQFLQKRVLFKRLILSIKNLIFVLTIYLVIIKVSLILAQGERLQYA